MFIVSLVSVSVSVSVEPRGVFPQSFDGYVRTRFGEEVGPEFLRLSDEVSALLPGARAKVDKKYFRYTCMGRLKTDSLWMKKEKEERGLTATTQATSESSSAGGATAAASIKTEENVLRPASSVADTGTAIAGGVDNAADESCPPLKKVKFEDSTSG
jgi:hypothetical protein